MSPSPLWVVGGGEHGRVVIEAAMSRSDLWQVAGFVDPAACDETAKRYGLRQHQDIRELADLVGEWPWVVIGVGLSPGARRRQDIASQLAGAGVRFATVVHERAWVSPTASLGQGTVVLAGATVNAGVVIGDHCIVNTGVIVEHDVSLGAFTHAAPGATIGGGAVVGRDSYLGLGCRVRDHITIGEGAVVGMGAVAVSPVGNGWTVLGVPARRFKGLP
jgi:acetyltransferase EpsM